jgi:hypothetical protein
MKDFTPSVAHPRVARIALACILAFASLLAVAAPGQALSLKGASGLTEETADLVVQGKIAGGSPLYLDLAAVSALPSRTFTSIDPWDGKEHSFEGVLLSDLMAAVGIDAAATRITVLARNKYSIPIRRADYERYGYILAWKIDGHLFAADESTRNRGVFSVAIDFAGNKALDPNVFKHQLVWQAKYLTAE